MKNSKSKQIAIEDWYIPSAKNAVAYQMNSSLKSIHLHFLDYLVTTATVIEN